MGQCHPIPKDTKLREQMRKHARNYKRIYNMYNLPYLAKPGDDLFAAARLQHIQDLKKEFLKRLEAGEDEIALLQELEESTGFVQVRRLLECPSALRLQMSARQPDLLLPRNLCSREPSRIPN